MAVKIRLKRVGRKKVPAYRVVVSDDRSPRDGRFVEELGHYQPAAEPPVAEINEERARYWLAEGAQPTGTVRALFRRLGITGDAETQAAERS